MPVPSEWKIPNRVGHAPEFRARLYRLFARLTGTHPQTQDPTVAGAVRWFAELVDQSPAHMRRIINAPAREGQKARSSRELQPHHWLVLTLLERLLEYREELEWRRRLGL